MNKGRELCIVIFQAYKPGITVFGLNDLNARHSSVAMREFRTAIAPAISKGEIDDFERTAPKKYFNLSIGIMVATGMYPISSERSFILRLLFSIYFWSLYLFLIVLNPITKAIVLPYQTNLDEITDNISFLINHLMTGFKIALFIHRRKDLTRLVETIEGPEFRHKDCGQKFSANGLIRKAVRTSNAVYYIFSSFVVGLIFNSIISATIERSEETILYSNDTESAQILPRRHRALPFHAWYPFSTQNSPVYEIVFIYQIVALFCTAEMVMALDTMVVGFMIHIKVQCQILSHNLRFVKSHAENKQKKKGSQTISEQSAEARLVEAIELDFGKCIAHHRAIIKLSEDLESVFGYQLLLQFICSLLATCMLLWQVSSTPVLSARFASMLSYLGATAFQLFIYCWFGNEMMLESLSVAEAAWESGWYEIASRRFCHGVAMIMHRSQKVIMITAGGFVDLTLDTFMTISRAAYSCFAVLKKING